MARELARRAPEAAFLGRDVADLSDPAGCARMIRAHAPDIVINAAAWTAVDKAEDHETEARVVNGDAPAAMARAAADLGIPFLHISTDYVFDGAGEAPRCEEDPVAPLNAYGRTKLAGEEGVAEAGGRHAILRTSWIFSAFGANFVKTMLRLSETREALSIVDDQVGGPTHAGDIAVALLVMTESLQEGRGESGIYHLAGVSGHELGLFRARNVRSGRAADQGDRDRHGRVSHLGQAAAELATGLREDRACLRHFPARLAGCGEPDPYGPEGRNGMSERKGVILAGGSGTRLYPITQGVSKQLLPLYDKPMIYYPLTVLMLAGIREIAVITTHDDADQFRRTLGDGSQWGIELTYVQQPSPDGLAQAYLLTESFLNGAPSAMVLGDNIFFGHGLPEILAGADRYETGGTVFGYHVGDPERYGVIDFDANGRARAIVEKPQVPPSNYAVTGLYFLDGTAPERAKRVEPSARGELEITSLLESYLAEGQLRVERMGRGYAWLDTGTHGSLLDAGNFVRTLTERQGLQVGSPDEVAFNLGWIDAEALAERARRFSKTAYGLYLGSLAKES